MVYIKLLHGHIMWVYGIGILPHICPMATEGELRLMEVVLH